MTDPRISLPGICIAMTAAVVLLAVLYPLLRKHVRPEGRYLLWLLILLRLCLPFGAAPLPALWELPADQVLPEIVIPVVSAPAPAPSPTPIPSFSATQEVPEQSFSLPAKDLLLLLWAAGTVLMLSLDGIRYLSFVRRVSRSLRLPSENTAALYRRLTEKQKRPPALYISDEVPSPLLMGLRSPKILLPDESFREEALQQILLHELSHHQRKDLLAKLLGLLARALHWFNPAVHFAARMMNREMELSCDRRVLKNRNEEERLDYGELLLELVRRSHPCSTTLTTCFFPKKHAFYERLENIFDTRAKRRGTLPVILCLLLCLVSGSLFACTPAALQRPARSLHQSHSAFDALSNEVLFSESDRVIRFTEKSCDGLEDYAVHLCLGTTAPDTADCCRQAAAKLFDRLHPLLTREGWSVEFPEGREAFRWDGETFYLLKGRLLAASYCANREISVPDGVEAIAPYAFRSPALHSLSLPASLSAIGQNAFFGCSELKSVTRRLDHRTPTSPLNCSGALGYSYFPAQGATESGAESLYLSLSKLRDAAPLPAPVDDERAHYAVENGVLTAYYGVGGHLLIPEGVTEIRGNVFDRCHDNVLSVTLPSTLKILRSNAFAQCNHLSKLDFPASIQRIEANAVWGSSSSLLVVSGIPADCTVEENAFPLEWQTAYGKTH